jgi:hypothetical protein
VLFRSVYSTLKMEATSSSEISLPFTSVYGFISGETEFSEIATYFRPISSSGDSTLRMEAIFHLMLCNYYRITRPYIPGGITVHHYKYFVAKNRGHRVVFRKPLCSSAHSSSLKIQRSRVRFPALPDFGPPLWSSSQSFWLLTQRSRVRFSALPNFLLSSRSGTGSSHPL